MNAPRCTSDRPVAEPLPGRPQETFLQSKGVDQNHRRDRGRLEQILKGTPTSRLKHVLVTLLTDLFQGIETFGLNVDKNNNVVYREWAPNAQQAFLIGDFSKYHEPHFVNKRPDLFR